MDVVEAIAVGSSEELSWLLIGVPSVLVFPLEPGHESK